MTEIGTELAPIIREITQIQIAAYAGAAGDFNPIHLDEEFAKTTQFGGTIAHGMMIAGLVSELIATSHKRTWPESCKLKLRFKAPVRPGDIVTAHAKVKQIRGTELTYSVGVRNHKDEDVIIGDATVAVGVE